MLGGIFGAVIGALVGRAIARHSRAKASQLILEGNRIVLEDIGGQTAKFVSLFENSEITSEKLSLFTKGLVSGQTETGGQDLLKRAFQAYAESAIGQDITERRQACYFANCLAIFHEHIRLQPYISGSMPRIIRRCVTERMMQYEIGDITLAVSEELPEISSYGQDKGLAKLTNEELIDFLYGPKGLISGEKGNHSTSARDWTDLGQRMRYVVKLFRNFHLDPCVRSHPYG